MRRVPSQRTKSLSSGVAWLMKIVSRLVMSARSHFDEEMTLAQLPPPPNWGPLVQRIPDEGVSAAATHLCGRRSTADDDLTRVLGRRRGKALISPLPLLLPGKPFRNSF